MTAKVKTVLTFVMTALFVMLILACSEPKEAKAPAFLIKTPAMAITSFDFSEELDLKRAAYPYNIDENPAEYNEMVIHLVKILSEEIVLLSAAEEKGVVVSDEELNLAEAEFKKDYPGDSFDQMLLKNALSYSFWKKRFKRNMIMEKLVDQELKEKIEITSQDIVDFYEDLKAKEILGPENSAEFESSVESENKAGKETELVARLRMQKTQDMYDEWIQNLWTQYPVEINKNGLKTFLIALENTEGSENETKN